MFLISSALLCKLFIFINIASPTLPISFSISTASLLKLTISSPNLLADSLSIDIPS
ncbi:hypothetical protein HanPSC8_Chr05g0195971 [Helianthus annuus]|nr:hypothetical protein HanPSC8_Chr05g0195971 [Helianthus annuus]